MYTMVYTIKGAKMPIRYSSAELIRIVKQDGWCFVSINGSHHKFKHPKKPGIVVIPHPKQSIPPGTAAQILRMAGLK
jgi:predicted RNA binding protein YcfA (HicA-like mRNA interferase family)